MRKKLVVVIVVSLVMSVATFVQALTIDEELEKMFYPMVRVNEKGSGSIVYSQADPELNKDVEKSEPGRNLKLRYSTYVLTNWHVIADKIEIVKERNSYTGKEEDKEIRSLVYVEIFEYKNKSVKTGVRKVEADIVLYNRFRDVALLKLGIETKLDYVVTFLPEDRIDSLCVRTPVTAAGCALGWSPILTDGTISEQYRQLTTREEGTFRYHMSDANIIYGHSGGAIFLTDTGEFIGIPSRVPALGMWGSDPVTFMGIFIPLEDIYKWLRDEHYDFIFDKTKTEAECLALREQELRKKREQD